MSSLIGRFQRDLIFLQANKIPQTDSGHPIKELDYAGEKHEKLNDDDVKRLVDALRENNVFFGPLCLKKNNLTDQSALYLADLLSKKGRGNIEKLDLSGLDFTTRAGEFIGDALISNPDCELEKLEFEDVNLGSYGLQRIVEATNACRFIEKVHFGDVTDEGLKIIAEHIKPNTGLRKIKFEEKKSQPWTQEVQEAFAQVFKENTEIEKVKFKTFDDDLPRNEAFEKQLKFYCKKTAKTHKKEKKFRKRMEKMSDENIFEATLALLEKKKGKKMLVRKFFNNTFDTVLNDAIFAMKKKQSKEPNRDDEIFTVQGAIKYVAQEIQRNLPVHEREPDMYDEDEYEVK